MIEALRPWFPGLPLERVRLVQGGPVCWFVRSVLRQGAMTVYPFVFLGRARYDPVSPRFLSLMAHEMKHIEQYRRYGLLPFLARYLWDLARHGFRYSQRLPLEAEAYALQAEFEGQQRQPGA